MLPTASDLLPSERSPSPAYRAGTSASSLMLAQSPSTCASSISPHTPATPWIDDTPPLSESVMPPTRRVEGEGQGVGLGVVDSRARPKLTGRGGVSRARVEVDEDERRELDDELDDELNDFGYGSRPTKRRDRTESLLDMLNSEPPAWMIEGEPVPVSLPNRKSSTLPGKIRRKFSANPGARESDVQAGFTTLQRGGSKQRKQDTSPLRSSRSAGSLLTSFRSRTSNFAFKIPGGGGNRSQEDLKGSVDLGTRPTHVAQNASRAVLDDDEFERLIGATSRATSTKRLTAKEPISVSPSSRDLADFLQSSSKSTRPALGNSQSSNSLASTGASSALTGSVTGGLTVQTAHSGVNNRAGPGGGDNSSIVRAAMGKLGAATRRASVGTATSFSQLVSSRPSTSSGIPRLSPTRTRFKRPSTAQTVASDESAYDPQNKETIQVDETLLQGMFGQGANRNAQETRYEGTREVEERDGEESRRRPIGDSSPALGVYEFVEVDERESGGKSPELYRLGSLTTVSTVRRVPAGSPTSINSTPTKLPSPRRKPVPLPGNAKDPSAGEHQSASSRSSIPFSSLVPTLNDAATPTTPYETYSTPPLTPAPDLARASISLAAESPQRQLLASSSETPGAPLDARPSTPELSSGTPSVASEPLATPSKVRPSRPPSREPLRPRPIVLQARDTTLPNRRSSSAVLDNDGGGSETAKLLNLGRDVVPLASSRSLDSSELEPDTAAAASRLRDGAIAAALEAWSATMAETANLAQQIDSTSLPDLVPTLRGFQRSMDQGSKLIEAILARVDESTDIPERRNSSLSDEGEAVTVGRSARHLE
ncbi:hypothetical protein JCM11491_005317 [Sporobolomyces phaffii]